MWFASLAASNRVYQSRLVVEVWIAALASPAVWVQICSHCAHAAQPLITCSWASHLYLGLSYVQQTNWYVSDERKRSIVYVCTTSFGFSLACHIPCNLIHSCCVQGSSSVCLLDFCLYFVSSQLCKPLWSASHIVNRCQLPSLRTAVDGFSH